MTQQLELTSSQAAYGLSEFHPELYKAVVAASQQPPGRNLTFVSAWGEALTAAAKHMDTSGAISVYETFNREVNKEVSMCLRLAAAIKWGCA